VKVVSGLLNLITSWLKYHKAKTLLVIATALIFLVLRFPFGELAPRVSAQLRQQVPLIADLDFQSLGVSLTGLGVEAKGVELLLNASELAKQVPALSRVRQIPPIKAERVLYGPRSFWPSSFQLAPDGLLVLEGLAQGALSARFQPVTAGSPDEYRIEVSATDLALRELFAFLQKQSILPVQLLVGSVSLATDGTLRMKEMPKSALQGRLQVKGFQFPAQPVATMMGAIAAPELAFDQSELEFKTELLQGRVNVSKLQLGRTGSPLSVGGRGSLALEFLGSQAVPTSYEFELDIKMSSEEFTRLKATLGAFGSLLLGNAGCPAPAGQSLSYRVSIQGDIPGPTRRGAGLPKVQCLR
jgi:hypothetical protein